MLASAIYFILYKFRLTSFDVIRVITVLLKKIWGLYTSVRYYKCMWVCIYTCMLIKWCEMTLQYKATWPPKHYVIIQCTESVEYVWHFIGFTSFLEMMSCFFFKLFDWISVYVLYFSQYFYQCSYHHIPLFNFVYHTNTSVKYKALHFSIHLSPSDCKQYSSVYNNYFSVWTGIRPLKKELRKV